MLPVAVLMGCPAKEHHAKSSSSRRDLRVLIVLAGKAKVTSVKELRILVEMEAAVVGESGTASLEPIANELIACSHIQMVKVLTARTHPASLRSAA